MVLIRLTTLLVLLATLSAARATLKSWLNPVTALGAPFAISLAVQLVAFRDFPFGWRAGAVIVAGPLALLLGGALAVSAARVSDIWREKRNTVLVPARAAQRFGGKHLLTLLNGIALAVALCYTYLLYQDIVVRRLGVVDGVFYRELFLSEEGYSWSRRALQLSMYCSALFIGVDVVARGFKRWSPVMFLGLAAVQSLLLSTRSSVFIVLLLLAAVYGLARPEVFGRITARGFITAAALTLAMVVLFGQIALSRAGHGGGVQPLREFGYFVAGGPSALSLALDDQVVVNTGRDFGLSVAGLLELAGGSERRFGIYEEATVSLRPREPRAATNIYTIYYPLIVDFGIPTMVAILVALGFLLQVFTIRVHLGSATVRQLCVAAILYVVLLWGLNTLLTYYNFFYVVMLESWVLGFLYRHVPVPVDNQVKSGAA